jgi:hypothetical protein
LFAFADDAAEIREEFLVLGFGEGSGWHFGPAGRY